MLEVVQDEQSELALKVTFEQLEQRLIGAFADPQLVRDGRGDQCGFLQGGERHEENAAGEELGEPACGFNGEPGFADPARPGDRDEASALLAQDRTQLRLFRVASDDRSGSRR